MARKMAWAVKKMGGEGRERTNAPNNGFELKSGDSHLYERILVRLYVPLLH